MQLTDHAFFENTQKNHTNANRALQLLAEPGCWGFEGDAGGDGDGYADRDDGGSGGANGSGSTPCSCSAGPLRLLRELCERHPPALSLSLSRLCGDARLAANCAAGLAARDVGASEPLIG